MEIITYAPSTKQVAYANNIANELGLKVPEEYTSKAYFDFIAENVGEYKQKINNFLTEQTKKFVQKSHFSEETYKVISQLTRKAGVYFLFCEDELVYIGQSVDLATRLLTSSAERNNQANITHLAWKETKTGADAILLEPICIMYYKPRLNSQFVTNSKVTFMNLKEIIDRNNLKIKTLKRYEAFKGGDIDG